MGENEVEPEVVKSLADDIFSDVLVICARVAGGAISIYCYSEGFNIFFGVEEPIKCKYIILKETQRLFNIIIFFWGCFFSYWSCLDCGINQKLGYFSVVTDQL